MQCSRPLPTLPMRLQCAATTPTQSRWPMPVERPSKATQKFQNPYFFLGLGCREGTNTMWPPSLLEGRGVVLPAPSEPPRCESAEPPGEAAAGWRQHARRQLPAVHAAGVQPCSGKRHAGSGLPDDDVTAVLLLRWASSSLQKRVHKGQHLSRTAAAAAVAVRRGRRIHGVARPTPPP